MARTEEEIYDELKNRTDQTKFIVDMQERGILDQLYSVEAATLSHDEQINEELAREGNLVTATTEEAIKKLCRPFYAYRTANQSSVVLTFTRQLGNDGNPITTEDILIPQGTLVETQNQNPDQYRTVSEVWIYQGSNYCRVVARSVDRGSNTMVGAGQLTVVTMNEVQHVTVNNEKRSWGGFDNESVDDIKLNALNARILYDKVTENGVRYQMSNMLGIVKPKYNLVDLFSGNGSAAIYYDTDVPEDLENVKNYIRLAEGIMTKFDYAEKVPLNFAFDVGVSSRGDVLPNVRDQMKMDIEERFRWRVYLNGVGQKLYLTSVANYILNQLEIKYDFYQIKINSDAEGAQVDVDGNIILEPNQVINPVGVVINIVAS